MKIVMESWDIPMYIYMAKSWENHRKMVVEWDLMVIYPLVNSHITNWKDPPLNGKTQYGHFQ